MKLFFFLHNDSPKLAKAEILESIDSYDDFISKHSYLILSCKNHNAIKDKKTIKTISRLAYTRYVGILLFKAKIHDLISKIKEHDWEKIIEQNFFVKTKNMPSKRYSSQNLGKIIWKTLKKPSVDKRGTTLMFHMIDNIVFVTKIIATPKHEFDARKAHNRPHNHPTSLSPKLACAMLNMANAEKIIDPFCGTGGLVLEAAYMNKQIIGIDIRKDLIDKAKENIKHFGLLTKKVKLIVADSTSLDKKTLDYTFKRHAVIVTELPFGRNSTISKDKHLLFKEFLETRLSDKIIASFPDDKITDKIIRSQKHWTVSYNIKIYVHKTLSKCIVVLRRNKKR